MCSHTCSLSEVGVKCLCPQLFKLDKSDNATCRASEKSILISSHSYIYRVTMDTPTHQVSLIDYNDISYSIAIGFDAKNQRVVFRDAKIGIVALSLDGSNMTQLNSDNRAFSIAVDNVAGNLYWVRNNLVKCSRLDGLHIRTLHTAPKDQTISDIAVYPQKQVIFWTVRSESYGSVMRAALDGSASISIDSLPTKPTGIAVDFRDDRVYYADLLDAQHTLISIDMDGTNRRKLYQGLTSYFQNICVFNKLLYTSTW